MLGGFISLAVVIDRDLSFILFGYGFNLTLVLLLVGIRLRQTFSRHGRV